MNYTLKKIGSKIFSRKNLVPVRFSKRLDNTRVVIHTIEGEKDVSGRCTLVSLVPVIITVGIAKEMLGDMPEIQLDIFHDGKQLASFQLDLMEELQQDGCKFCLFRISSCRNLFFNPISLYINSTYLWFQKISNTNPYNFLLSSSEFHKLHSYYLMPKPVVIVSVCQEGEYDFFPMDNIGYVSDDIFLLGLRNTSPSLSKIIITRKICLSDIPFDKKEYAYTLGKHHKDGHVDLKSVGFGFLKSELYSFMIPDFALEVKELEVLSNKVYGSHTLIVCRVVNDYSLLQGTQLAHVPWYYNSQYEQRKPQL